MDWLNALCGFIVLGQGYRNAPENLSSHQLRIPRTAPGDETRLPCNKEPHALQKIIALFALALGLAACGPATENDPIYQALKANPPTEIPARHLPNLRRGQFSCDVGNEGRHNQYMTCWWPQSFKPTKTAYFTYYGPSIPHSPKPSMITVPGGHLISENIAVN